MIEDTLETPMADTASDISLNTENLLTIPAGKLDADQYIVADLDGVTESLFGSGNMNFLMMQSAQTNELARTRGDGDFSYGNDMPLTMPDRANSANSFASPHNSHDGFENTGARTAAQPADDYDFAALSGGNNNALTATGIGGPGTASAVGSNPFSLVQNFADGNPGAPPTPPLNGQNGSNGTNGTIGSNGTDGTNGVDGTGGTGDTIINNVTELVENITNNNTDLLETIVNNASDIVTTVTNNVFNTVNNLFDGEGLPLFPIGLDLLVDLGQITNINLDIFSNNTIINILEETLDISLITNITDALADISTVLNLNLLLFPFNYDESPDDLDLNVIGDLHLPFLPPIDIHVPLDPVETLLGDIDLNLDVTNELLGSLLNSGDADTDLDLGLGIGLLDNTLLNDGLDLAFNPVENLLGDLDMGITPSLDLFGSSETDNAAGDTDIVIPLDLDIAGADILNDTLSLNLDALESITGDIDLDVTAALNLLGDAADDLLDGELGGDGHDGLLSFVGDIASGLVSPLFPVNDGNDMDLGLDALASILNQPVVDNALDLNLDIVEDLTGDLDLSLSPVVDLLGAGTGGDNLLGELDIDFIDNPLADALVDLPATDILSGDLLGGINLLGDTAFPIVDNAEGGSSQDTLLSDIGDNISAIVDNILPAHDGTLLDGLFGTIDQTLDTAFTLLEDTTDTGNLLDIVALDGLTGGDDSSLWTENLLPDAGDLLGGGLLSGPSGILPDPFTLAPDLAATTSNLLSGGLAGLGGDKHFGGLFG